MYNHSKLFRRTKILATTGPSTDQEGMLKQLIKTGVNAFRINCSHGTAEERIRRITEIRNAADELNTAVSVLFDLQGPKIRTGKFTTGSIELTQGQTFTLDTELGLEAGDSSRVGVTYKHLMDDLSVNDILLLDDGRIQLQVTSLDKPCIHCVVIEGGVLSNHKGINVKGGGLSAPALTEKDIEDLKQAISLDADYLAVSFPKCADDMRKARALLKEHGGENLSLVAKIERAESIQPDTLDAIILESDIVMVARGDLGVEVGDAALPQLQKHIIKRARTLDRGVITATQMMESMIENALPTRAEIFDVANAVFDGTDAIMLSAETAVGAHPIEVIKAVHRTCMQAEQQRVTSVSKHRVNLTMQSTESAIAMASMYTLNHLPDALGIAALTESGQAPMYMSRISSGKIIFAATINKHTFHRMSLYRGVYPVLLRPDEINPDQQPRMDMVEALRKRNVLTQGNQLILTSGVFQPGGTNTMEIVTI